LFLVAHPTPRKDVITKIIDNLSSYPADRQTHKGKNITSSAEVMITTTMTYVL